MLMLVVRRWRHGPARRRTPPPLAVATTFLTCATLAIAAGSHAAAAPATLSSSLLFGAQPVPAADGPVVVGADPFSLEASPLAPGQIELATVSARPSLVSGDRVRIELRGLLADDSARMKLDGRDVAAAFSPIASRPGALEGVVTALHVGDNTLVATVSGSHGVRTATLVVVDHPIDGPVISGAHQEPFICETEASGMGAATTPDCDAPTQFHWYARSAVTGQFTRLSNPYGAYPPDTASTMVNGATVPFVVRIESSVINRSITRIAVLDDPHSRGPSRMFVPREWNGRMLYVFGEFCGPGYHQGVIHETDLLGDPQAISDQYAMSFFADMPGHIGKGYIVTMSSLTTLAVNCNPLISAETTMMVKEHIVDDYGLITHTIGVGGSGGAIQQHTTANMYPGLLDAGTPYLSFPDMWNPFTTVLDCHLLQRVFAADPVRWTPAKQQAVTGQATSSVCRDWDTAFTSLFDPTNCPAGIPADQRYDPSRNPHGVRCDIQESQRNIWGVDPLTGFANRPLDNVGVQYGLLALRQGLLTADDFVALNRAAGGMDIDSRWIPQRTAMPLLDPGTAFATGEETGRGAINEIPLIDQTVLPVDYMPMYDVHDQNRPFQMRARLDATFGSHANQAIWSLAPYPQFAVDVAEDWLQALDALQASHPELSRAQAIARSRPAAAADQCRILLTGVPGPCEQGVLRPSSTRQAAGGPLSEDVVKCRLRPVAADDYPATLTATQLAQLRGIFTEGVCDWSQQSTGAVPRSQTWLTWGTGGPGTEPVTVPYPLARSAPPGAAQPAGVVASSLPNTGTGGGGAALVSFIAIAGLARVRRRRR